MVFRRSDNLYTLMAFRVDDNGSMWVQARAHGSLTAKNPYLINIGQYGWATQALASGTVDAMVGWPDEAYSTGDIANLQIAGYISSAVFTSGVTFTAGDWIYYAAGAFACASVDSTHTVIGMVHSTGTGGAGTAILGQTGLSRFTS